VALGTIEASQLPLFITCRTDRVFSAAPVPRSAVYRTGATGLQRRGSPSSRCFVFSETQVAAKARREVGSTISTMIRAGTTTPTVAKVCRAAFGAKATPGAADRRLSAETIMVSQMLHFLSIHNPTAATSPTMPSTIPP
jgi:hypothetical protein